MLLCTCAPPLCSPKGECKQLVEYGWQLTGAPDVSTPAATADLKMELTAVAAPNFVPVHADFKYSAGNALRKGDGVPGRDGCLNSNGGDADGDIWDVQIVSGAALPEFVAAGYKVAQDADVTWAGVQPGDTSVTVSRFEGEINAWMGKVRACVRVCARCRAVLLIARMRASAWTQAWPA